jgi:uncharacterized protein
MQPVACSMEKSIQNIHNSHTEIMEQINTDTADLHILNQMFDGCITTYTGKKFNFLNPTEEMIDIHDIAKGLAYKAHFAGQIPKYFSIAQHSLMVYNRIGHDESYMLKLAALLHDASEAYTGDMVKPLKNLLPDFKEIENKIMRVILNKFGLDMGWITHVKPFDLIIQQQEYDQFYRHKMTFQCLSPDEAAHMFLQAFDYVKPLPRR